MGGLGKLMVAGQTAQQAPSPALAASGSLSPQVQVAERVWEVGGGRLRNSLWHNLHVFVFAERAQGTETIEISFIPLNGGLLVHIIQMS